MLFFMMNETISSSLRFSPNPFRDSLRSSQIDTLIEEVEDTPKPPLNKENMVELAGCMVAGVFTAILRST